MNRAVIVLFAAIGKGLGLFASSASAESVAAFVNAAGIALAEVSAGFLDMHSRERAVAGQDFGDDFAAGEEIG